MKGILFVISLVLIAHQNGVGDRHPSRAETTHIDAVLALECDPIERNQRAECVDRYESAFRSGELDPLAVLRMRCTRWQNPWERASGEPPPLCVEYFGGWVGS